MEVVVWKHIWRHGITCHSTQDLLEWKRASPLCQKKHTLGVKAGKKKEKVLIFLSPFKYYLDHATVTWWLTETRRWEWYSPPVELKLSSSQKVTVRNECGSHRCSHLSDLGSPDIGRGRRKWSQMIGGGTPNGSGVPFPSTEVNTKKGSFWATLVGDGR